MRRIRITKAKAAALAALLLLGAGVVVARNDRIRNRDLYQSSFTSTENRSTLRTADSSAMGKMTPAPQADVASDSLGSDSVASGGGSAMAQGSPVVPGSPRVVRTAELRVEVAKNGFGAAFDRVASIAASHGGFVASSSTASSVGESGRQVPSGELAIRVPADRFDSARQALAGLGKVETQAIRGEDVSGQIVDYDARLRSLTAQEDALRTLVGKAGSVGEVLQVQSTLFGVRQQIEQLSAQRADLDQRASLSSISVSLFEPGAQFVTKPVPEPATGLAGSLERAVDGAISVVGGMMVALGWTTPVAALGLVLWLLARLARAARRPPAVPVA